jgi:hypothetical protein
MFVKGYASHDDTVVKLKEYRCVNCELEVVF